MTDELLFKYISDQVTPEEMVIVQDWVSGSEDRKKELTHIKNVWVMSGLENEIDPIKKDQEIERILNTIRLLSVREQKNVSYIRFFRYAAALFLLIGLSGLIGYYISNLSSKSNSEYTEIIVPKGERSTVVLPDGSTVKLNSNSRLKFIAAFNSGERRVLLDGEGFFNVTHNKSHPFVVETSNIQVEVLGTSFNVSSYPNDTVITTFLESGSVKIYGNGSDHIFLRPDEAYSYNKITHESEKMKMTDPRFTNWTKGIMTINGETIGELAKKIERRFNIQIIFGDNEVKQHMYTGSIRDEDIVTVLEALKFASSINYERNGDIVTIHSRR